MIELCHIAAGNVADLDVMNRSTISGAISDLTDPEKTRFVVTDQTSLALFDSMATGTVEGKLILYPEVITAMEGNTVFRWNYQNGVMHSYAAVPIMQYGSLIGCIYMTDHDVDQGALISTLQNNILTVTILLEIVVILFSLVFSKAHTRRLRKIMSSIRTVRDGDYTHKLQLSGHDELNILSSEFNDLISRLQISENKRNRFVSDASHELKTPLASIKLLSDSILQNEMEESTVREFVSDIGAEAERLNRMSEKLLTLSRIDGHVPETASSIYIAPTVERVTRMLSVSAEKQNITIVTDLANDRPILIAEDDLYQVIFNLVENGIKYNRKGGTLYIALSATSDRVTIQIRDTGVGIPQDSIDHVFERFYRVDKARSRSTGGSGLGLSIVRNIVRHNGGDIQVKSIQGEGTTMQLEFPILETGGKQA